MIWQLLKDPFLYLNYGAAALGIYTCWRWGKQLGTITNPIQLAVTFILFSIIVGGCLYLTVKFGDISLMKLGIKP